MIDLNYARQCFSKYFQAKSEYGLEIGPFHRPIFSKKHYCVKVADVCSRKELVKKVAHEKAQKNIEEVDFIIDHRGLLAAIGNRNEFDYIVSSHVFEHLPNPIEFFKDCYSLLKERGVLALIIPDKRTCLDFHKPLTSTGMMLQAFHSNGSYTLQSAFDAKRYGVAVFPNEGEKRRIAWDFTLLGEISNRNSDNSFPKFSRAYSENIKAIYKQALDSSVMNSFSGHRWALTCTSFLHILFDLKALELVEFELLDIMATGKSDFIVILGKNVEKEQIMNLNNALV